MDKSETASLARVMICVEEFNSVNFKIKTPKKEIIALLNPQLYGWTIENLIKNSILVGYFHSY